MPANEKRATGSEGTIPANEKRATGSEGTKPANEKRATRKRATGSEGTGQRQPQVLAAKWGFMGAAAAAAITSYAVLFGTFVSSDSQQGTEMIKTAVSILETKPDTSQRAMRKWAVDILAHFSPRGVHVTADMRRALELTTSLPVLAIAPNGNIVAKSTGTAYLRACLTRGQKGQTARQNETALGDTLSIRSETAQGDTAGHRPGE